MKFKAEVKIMPHKEILDPQGKAVMLGLHNLDFHNVDQVRVGKHIDLYLEAIDENEAAEKIEEACKKLLANVIMESYSYKILAE